MVEAGNSHPVCHRPRTNRTDTAPGVQVVRPVGRSTWTPGTAPAQRVMGRRQTGWEFGGERCGCWSSSRSNHMKSLYRLPPDVRLSGARITRIGGYVDRPMIDEVPWGSIKGKLLEELIHELVEAMGGVDIIWRTGGTGDGAADGGRDIEASFIHTTPDGDVRREKWWIESKGRAGSVEPMAVKSAVLNVAARDDVDVLVIASNSQFTNPTRDWVEAWQQKHPRPQVRLWDRARMDSLVRRHPVASARVIPSILKGEERLRLLVDQFAETGRVPLEADLEYFWQNKDLVTRADEISCLTYAEVTLGNLTLRPWGTLAAERISLEMLIEAFVGITFAAIRTGSLSDSKITDAAAHLVHCGISGLTPDVAWKVINNPFEFLEGEFAKRSAGKIKVYREVIIQPIWGRAIEQLLSACADDCIRVSASPEVAFGARPEGPSFWRRMNPDLPAPDDEGLIIENREKPCAVGLDLSGRSCPLIGKNCDEEGQVSHRQVLDVKHVISYRTRRPSGRFMELYRASDS